ncbi:exodeoxyribonuclease VII small subunit [Flaviflexus huanghaiensis]|uniref:exodeoxyribonuclease VII small subunit n=1 Tax=Flaviflexus huanghaiensis TaxID=1111473 RepID=UPI0015FC5BD3|nr:exodeoxyribonuclease VII small subunit [Flaviflexus huanghaiensis]
MTEKNDDIADLTYEEARRQLVEIVAALEQGTGTLEESITAWERGEALARRCQQWLDGARVRLQSAQLGRQSSDTEEEQ